MIVAKRVSPDEKQKMVEMHQEGWTATAIADKLERSEDTIRKYLAEAGEDVADAVEEEDDDEELDEPPAPTPEGSRRGIRPPPHAYDDSEPGWEDEENPWGIGGGEFHEILAHVLSVVGADKKKADMAVNAVKLNHGYQTYDALYQFLVGLKFPVAQIKVICDLTINQFYQQQQQVRGPYGGPMPQMGGGPPMQGPPYPSGPPGQNPAYPPQYPGQPPQYPGQPPQQWQGYYPPQPQNSGKKAMSQEEIDKMVKERTAEALAAQNKETKLFGAINSLVDKVQELETKLETGGATGPMMIDEPMLDPETGKVLRDEDGAPFYRKVPYDPNHPRMPTHGGPSPYIRQLESQVEDLKRKQEAGPDVEKETMKSELTDLKMKSAMADSLNPLVNQVNALTTQNAALEARIQTQGNLPRGMSEDAQVAVAQLNKQTEIMKTSIDKAGNVLDKGVGIIEKMVVGETPEAYQKTPQWVKGELKTAQNWLEGD